MTATNCVHFFLFQVVSGVSPLLKAPSNYTRSNLGGAIFEWPLRVWMYLLRKGAYRDISHIVLKQTQ